MSPRLLPSYRGPVDRGPVIGERGAVASATRWTALAFVASLLAGCVDSTGPPFPHIELTEFAPSLGIDLDEMTRIGGGIYVQDLVEGAGDRVGPTDQVRMDYSLYLADGTLVERREDYRFITGCWQAEPRGLEAGLAGMSEGGQRRIIVPGRWGYLSASPPGVPFGAILVFVVEVRRTSGEERCRQLD